MVQDILILCADGLTGIKEAIATAYPKTEYRRCIVHQVRNTLKYVADKDKKEFAKDLRSIYTAPDEKSGRKQVDVFTAKWDSKYPSAFKNASGVLAAARRSTKCSSYCRACDPPEALSQWGIDTRH